EGPSQDGKQRLAHGHRDARLLGEAPDLALGAVVAHDVLELSDPGVGGPRRHTRRGVGRSVQLDPHRDAHVQLGEFAPHFLGARAARGFGHHGYPAPAMTYFAAQTYCAWLSAKTGKKYRLPTDAEWTRAARLGLGGDSGLTAERRDALAWHAGNAGAKAHPAAAK